MSSIKTILRVTVAHKSGGYTTSCYAVGAIYDGDKRPAYPNEACALYAALVDLTHIEAEWVSFGWSR